VDAETGRPQPVAPAAVLERVVAGADGSEAGFEAVRQAAWLAAPDGSLEVFTAVDVAEAVHTGFSAARIAEQLRADADDANRQAVELAGGRAEGRVVEGAAFPALLHELEATRATLVVVGTHGHRRFSEIVVGGVTGELLHRAPCSVLVARPPTDPDRFPRTVVAGDDGSECAALAVAVAKHLADRFDSQLRVLTAEEHPVQALAAAGRDADLLVVGSRGLRGLKALGSVSERVAHQATCSVLVVRPGRG
jgi:nucleotide-binding universal stress UspA family protein